LGVILLDGKNVNLEMLKAGLAEVYRGKPARGSDLRPFWDSEKKVRDSQKGMWKHADEYVSPREWRKMHRNGSHG
jgi:micrococcal nuclease